MQEKIVTWKPITTIFSHFPVEKGLIQRYSHKEVIDIIKIITRNSRTYIENIRCYCYLSNLTKISDWKVLGFVTDAPIEILNKSTLKRKLFVLDNPVPLKITNFGTCRYAQIDELYAKALFLTFYENAHTYICQMHFARNSEIIIGRHPIFAEINLNVAHTTTHYWNIKGNRFFISFITGLPTLREKFGTSIFFTV